jgi:hypothetical protein
MARTIWHIARNPRTQPCGCADWLQFERGEWVPKSWRCLRHEDG